MCAALRKLPWLLRCTGAEALLVFPLGNKVRKKNTLWLPKLPLKGLSAQSDLGVVSLGPWSGVDMLVRLRLDLPADVRRVAASCGSQTVARVRSVSGNICRDWLVICVA